MKGSTLVKQANIGEKFTSPTWFMNQTHFKEEMNNIYIQKTEDGFLEFDLNLSRKGEEFHFSASDKNAEFVKL